MGTETFVPGMEVSKQGTLYHIVEIKKDTMVLDPNTGGAKMVTLTLALALSNLSLFFRWKYSTGT